MIKFAVYQKRYNKCKLMFSHIGVLKCINRLLTDLKGERETNTLMAEGINTSLLKGEKINKEALNLIL